jgi:hypothetical protein
MSNSENISYLNGLLLSNIRTTFLTDALNLYLIVPMAVIGTYFNYVTLTILSKKSFRKMNIYKLMFIYSLISFIITLFMIFFFFYTPHILFELSISQMGRIYYCNLVNWFLLFFFYGNCIDILINLERALNFSKKFEKLKKTSPYLICFIVFIICVLIHLPSDLSLSYTSTDELYTKLRLCYVTSFATEPITRLILLISIIIEGPVVMILVIGSNILAFVSYKSFLKEKQTIEINRMNNNRQIDQLTDSEQKKVVKKEKMNQKLLKMTIFLTIFSIITHIIQFGAQIILILFSNTNNKSLYAWTFFIFSFVVIFKHFFTIFFYYLFNYKFEVNLNYFYNIRLERI